MGYALPPLPVFRDGAFLGANSALNRISQNQAYIFQATQGRFNAPFEWMRIDDTRRIAHRSRYLHWKTDSATAATLNLNGSPVDTASGADSGMVDLDGAGLSQNQVYSLKWTGTDVRCSRLYESPSATGVLSLPESNPTFTTGADAAQLNALSINTKYLLDYGAKGSSLAFVGKTHENVKGGFGISYTMIHLHRYLFWNGSIRHGGDPTAHDINFKLKINGTTIFEKDLDATPADGGRFVYFEAWIDLQGTDHTIGGYTISGSGSIGTPITNGSTLGLSPGDEYHLRWDGTADMSQSIVTTYQIAEYPQKVIW